MITLGVFDSGVGGLSVLHELLAQLPGVQCVYLADNAFAPYGERDVATIQARTAFAADYLRHVHQVDAMVIACNTATAQAVDALRRTHPGFPIVGVEPALKPATLLSKSGHIGVLATRSTLASDRFARLQHQTSSQSMRPVRFFDMACDGLADAIERDDGPSIRNLSQKYIANLLGMSHEAALIDTLVLGCTHYPFALEALTAAAPQNIRFLDTGLPVAKRARELLGLSTQPTAGESSAVQPKLYCTGHPGPLTAAAIRWIHPNLSAQPLISGALGL